MNVSVSVVAEQTHPGCLLSEPGWVSGTDGREASTFSSGRGWVLLVNGTSSLTIPPGDSGAVDV